MRSRLFLLAMSLMALALATGATRAAINEAPARSSTVEILIFEHPACTYCQALRRDVLPQNRQAPPIANIPLRFIDLEKSDIERMGLNARIHTVPTVVLMKDGHEVDRIVGYWAPENFFKMLAHILSKAE